MPAKFPAFTGELRIGTAALVKFVVLNAAFIRGQCLFEYIRYYSQRVGFEAPGVV